MDKELEDGLRVFVPGDSDKSERFCSSPEQGDEPAPVSRRRLKTLLGRLARHPRLLAQIEAIAAIADAGGGLQMWTADEVEAFIVEATRKLGNQTLIHWDEAAQEPAIEDCKKEHPDARLKKSGAELVVHVWKNHPHRAHPANAAQTALRRLVQTQCPNHGPTARPAIQPLLARNLAPRCLNFLNLLKITPEYGTGVGERLAAHAPIAGDRMALFPPAVPWNSYRICMQV
jgi:hypothetical protein